jgi:PatG Domain
MSELDSVERPTGSPSTVTVTAAAVPSLPAVTNGTDCPTCAGNLGSMSPPSYVYAIGKIEPRFPQLSVEKEFAQATGRAATKDLTDRQALHQVLREPANRYLARQLCWVMSIEGLETYILVPRDPSDFSLLIEALRPAPRATDIDVVIGVKGPIAPPTLCNGLMVPIIPFDQIYSFDVDTLLGSIPRPEGVEADKFKATAEEVLNRVMHVADNAGATDMHRALNYLVVRYPTIYGRAAEQFGRDYSLTGVEVRSSSLSGVRRILDVIFSYTNRQTDFTERFFVRVDVSEEFPFLVTKLSPYFGIT